MTQKENKSKTSEILWEEKINLEKKAKDKIILAVFLFIALISLTVLLITAYGDNQKKSSKEDKSLEIIQKYISYKISNIDKNIKLSENIKQEYINIVKTVKTACNRQASSISPENKTINTMACKKIDKANSEIKAGNIEGLSILKDLNFWIEEKRSVSYFLSLEEIKTYLFFWLLSLSGCIAFLLSYRADQNKIHTVMKNIYQHQRFELAAQQCLILESNEKLPKVAGIDIFELENKFKKLKTLEKQVEKSKKSYDKADEKDEADRKQEWENDLKNTQRIEKEIYTKISRLKLPQKKSIQVRADLIKAIYTYKQDKI